MKGCQSIGKTLAGWGAAASLVLAVAVGDARAAHHEQEEAKAAEISCELTFEYDSWSAFVSKGKGQGTVTCNNGQKADVLLEHTGVGLIPAKRKIDHGHGSFAYVTDIDDVFGEYSGSSASVGAGGTAAAGGLLKHGSPVKLGFYATGKKGVAFGRDWGKLTITRKE